MDNPVNLQELEKALDTIIMEDDKNALRDNELTVPRLVKRSGWSKNKAQRVLKEWEQAGIIVLVGKRREPMHGQQVDAWRLAENKSSLEMGIQTNSAESANAGGASLSPTSRRR